MSRDAAGPGLAATTLLVANRGEIAVRIMATAATMGLCTVAVHPADDAACAHVTQADLAVELPGSGVAAYLDVEAVVAAARRTGTDVVHPGYGFLAENAAFARRCLEAGVRFAGPHPDALALFGDKTRARAHARALGVPVLAGTDGPTDAAAARAFLDSLGPNGAVMVKALAGGGGRGMRPVTRPDELAGAVARCASEAQAAFGDGAVYVERLLPHARHVEVQVVGDGTGAVVVLGDRDCSIQRRRQKLVEIAPAPALPAGLRSALHDAARRLVAARSYAGLATVEFLVDAAGSGGTGAGEPTIAFLEVNPRIQVEHTVTEEITGLDLVELSLRVAAGATLAELGLTAPPSSRGDAVQVRVNAETVLADGTVRPGGGTLRRFQPPSGRGVRVDTHGYAGYPISSRYDSLLAKVVVTDPRADLATVLAKAGRALANFDVAGAPTNIALLRAVLGEPALAVGAADVSFLDTRLGDLVVALPEPDHAEPDHAEPDSFGRDRAGPDRAGPDRAGPDRAGPDRAGPDDDPTAVRSPQQGVVVAVAVAVGDAVAPGAELVVLEAMKMEHVVTAEVGGEIDSLLVKVGDVVEVGSTLAVLVPTDVTTGAVAAEATPDPDLERLDLAESLARHRVGLDVGRPEVVRRRHASGRRTARENVDDLCDPGSFVEYGALVVAAQRQRRTLDDLIERTPADGLVCGTATVGGRPVVVMSYDYTVLAGTQGIQNHRKTDRLLTIARQRKLPVVFFAEGGGGRPGDTDTTAIAQLDVPTFRLAASLAGEVPTVSIVAGYCFAGNAALVGVCDLVVATEGSSSAGWAWRARSGWATARSSTRSTTPRLDALDMTSCWPATTNAARR